jgi:hypothetical protein
MGLNFWKKICNLFDKPESKSDEGEPMNQTTEKPQGVKVEATKPAPQKHKVTPDDVCEQVLAKLGKPPKFNKCTACHITGTCNYRVNVWNKGEMSSGLITDSFFVKVNDEGVIVSPEIKRKYPSIHKA